MDDDFWLALSQRFGRILVGSGEPITRICTAAGLPGSITRGMQIRRIFAHRAGSGHRRSLKAIRSRARRCRLIAVWDRRLHTGAATTGLRTAPAELNSRSRPQHH